MAAVDQAEARAVGLSLSLALPLAARGLAEGLAVRDLPVDLEDLAGGAAVAEEQEGDSKDGKGEWRD